MWSCDLSCDLPVRYLFGWDETVSPVINEELCHPLCQCDRCSKLRKVGWCTYTFKDNLQALFLSLSLSLSPPPPPPRVLPSLWTTVTLVATLLFTKLPFLARGRWFNFSFTMELTSRPGPLRTYIHLCTLPASTTTGMWIYKKRRKNYFCVKNLLIEKERIPPPPKKIHNLTITIATCGS